jgi:hypothetical protein
MTFEQSMVLLQTLAQLGTFGFLVWYALETFWIRKAAIKQTETVSTQLKIMQETLDRQIKSDQLADEPNILWEQDYQLSGFMWKIRNTGGPVTFLETRCSSGIARVVHRYLATGESCFVTESASEAAEESDLEEEYYGLKYQSDLGTVREKVYRYDKKRRTLSETQEISYASLKNATSPS